MRRSTKNILYVFILIISFHLGLFIFDDPKYIFPICLGLLIIIQLVSLFITEFNFLTKKNFRYGKKQFNFVKIIFFLIFGILLLIIEHLVNFIPAIKVGETNAVTILAVFIICFSFLDFRDYVILIGKKTITIKYGFLSKEIRIEKVINITFEQEKIKINTRKKTYILFHSDLKDNEVEKLEKKLKEIIPVST